MEQIDFKKSAPLYPYVPYVPECVKAIEQPQRPPVITAEEGGPSRAAFTQSGLNFEVKLRFSCGGEERETPLAMCPYLKVTDEGLFDREVCLKCDLDNVARERHNKFLVGTLNEFIAANELGVSAGRLTAPPAPVDATAARLEAIKKLTSDKYETARKAIAYLSPFEIYCGRDYEFEGALSAANEKSFKEAIKFRIEKGKGRVRVNVQGRKPCWWDGVSPRDENGAPVRWEMGEGHTFLTPELTIVAYQEVTSLVPVSAAKVKVEAEAEPNPFDSLKIPDASSQLLAITDS